MPVPDLEIGDMLVWTERCYEIVLDIDDGEYEDLISVETWVGGSTLERVRRRGPVWSQISTRIFIPWANGIWVHHTVTEHR